MEAVLTVRSDNDDVLDEILTPIVEAAAEAIRQALVAQNVWAHIDVAVDGTRVRF